MKITNNFCAILNYEVYSSGTNVIVHSGQMKEKDTLEFSLDPGHKYFVRFKNEVQPNTENLVTDFIKSNSEITLSAISI
jgi:hypothetical protein